VACRSDRHESGVGSPAIHSGRPSRGAPAGLGCDPQPRQETTTRTNDMSELRELLEKSADADLLREMIGFAAERLIA
jgi:hypothetical protein